MGPGRWVRTGLGARGAGDRLHRLHGRDTCHARKHKHKHKHKYYQNQKHNHNQKHNQKQKQKQKQFQHTNNGVED